MDDGILHIAEIPYESGELRFRFARRLSDDGTKWIREGRFVEYSPSGQVLSEGEYENDTEHGFWRDYYENGQLAAEGCYDHGKEVGIWRFWNEDGTPEEPVEHLGAEASGNGGG